MPVPASLIPNPEQVQFLQLLDYNVCVSAAVYTEWCPPLTPNPYPLPYPSPPIPDPNPHAYP